MFKSKNCYFCKITFTPNSSNAKYCSRVCRDTHHTTEQDPAKRTARHPINKMLRKAEWRAKRDSLQFTLTHADIVIPETCPIIGIPLVFSVGSGYSPNSPTLDKIIPELGYTPENVQVISHKANVMKNNASIEELILFALWINANC